MQIILHEYVHEFCKLDLVTIPHHYSPPPQYIRYIVVPTDKVHLRDKKTFIFLEKEINALENWINAIKGNVSRSRNVKNGKTST